MGPWLFNAILKFFIFLENLLKKTRSMDEIRAKRLAYFQNLQLNFYSIELLTNVVSLNSTFLILIRFYFR